MLKTACTTTRNLYTDLVFMTVAPLVISVLILLYVIVRRICACRNRDARAAAVNQGAFAFLFLCFLIYPAVSQVGSVSPHPCV